MKGGNLCMRFSLDVEVHPVLVEHHQLAFVHHIIFLELVGGKDDLRFHALDGILEGGLGDLHGHLDNISPLGNNLFPSDLGGLPFHLQFLNSIFHGLKLLHSVFEIGGSVLGLHLGIFNIQLSLLGKLQVRLDLLASFLSWISGISRQLQLLKSLISVVPSVILVLPQLYNNNISTKVRFFLFVLQFTLHPVQELQAKVPHLGHQHERILLKLFKVDFGKA